MDASVDDLEAANLAFDAILATLTPAQMATFTGKLVAVAASLPSATTLASTPAANQYVLATPASGNSPGQNKNALRAKLKQRKLERSKLRPLNAFMAFRCK